MLDLQIIKLEEAINTKNEKLLKEIFYELEQDIPNYLESMNLLLLEDWHTYHYDIVLELQRLKNPQSIEPLYLHLTQNRESHLAYKIVWALADIGTAEAKAKITALIKYVSDIQVKLLISKRLQLWESERWRKELKPLPEGWYLTDEEDDCYNKELYVELAEGHALYGQPLRVVMCDGLHQEVMCQHLDKENCYSMVHLTWSGREEFEGYPSYSGGYTWEECCV